MRWSRPSLCKSFVQHKTKLQSFWYESHIQFSPMRSGPNVAQLTLSQVVKKAVKSTKNMQHNMAKGKQRSHRECPHHFWFHHRTTILCVCTLAQSEACRQATTEASQHNMEGSLPKTLHCKSLKAEDSASVNMCFLTLILGTYIQKVQCKARERERALGDFPKIIFSLTDTHQILCFLWRLPQ